jgi:hypothetical protein
MTNRVTVRVNISFLGGGLYESIISQSENGQAYPINIDMWYDAFDVQLLSP